jgi:hypothetical protein
VDVAFVLLIFFMITAPIMQGGGRPAAACLGAAIEPLKGWW